ENLVAVVRVGVGALERFELGKDRFGLALGVVIVLGGRVCWLFAFLGLVLGAVERFLGGHQTCAFGCIFCDAGGASRLAHFHVQLHLRAEPERYRVHGGQIGGVPMGIFTHRFDGRLGGA